MHHWIQGYHGMTHTLSHTTIFFYIYGAYMHKESRKIIKYALRVYQYIHCLNILSNFVICLKKASSYVIFTRKGLYK